MRMTIPRKWRTMERRGRMVLKIKIYASREGVAEIYAIT